MRIGYVRSRSSLVHEFKRLVKLMLPTSSYCKFKTSAVSSVDDLKCCCGK